MSSTLLNRKRNTERLEFQPSDQVKKAQVINYNTINRSIEFGDTTHNEQIQADHTNQENNDDDTLSTSTYDSSNLTPEILDHGSPMNSTCYLSPRDLYRSRTHIKVPRLQSPTKSSLMKRRRFRFAEAINYNFFSLAILAHNDSFTSIS